MTFDTTPTVDAIEQIEIAGNVIPPSWYQAIKTDTGKTALLAINILSDIVYWYRPTIRRDEESGRVESKAKKFKADKLQKSYGQYADFFGVPKDTVTDAVDLLVARGLITREFRTITAKGTVLNNVMFLEPVPAKIAEITFRNTPPMGEKPDRVSGKKTPTLPDKKGDTYTETTTETKEHSLSPADFDAMSVEQAHKVPELKLYAKATGFFPGSLSWHYVYSFICENKLTENQIRTAAEQWELTGYQKTNVKGILEWAKDGVPTRKKETPHPSGKGKAATALELLRG